MRIPCVNTPDAYEMNQRPIGSCAAESIKKHCHLLKKITAMKKIALIFAIALLPHVSQAGFFDDIATAVGGHIDDIQSRFEDDQIVEGKTLSSTQFRENDRGQDSLHHGSGTVTIVETEEGRFIQLGTDFTSTPGPDYHVYISQDANVDHEDRFAKDRQIELGKLVKGSGASFYKIPDGVDFQSVTIWCKAFGEFITSADFQG